MSNVTMTDKIVSQDNKTQLQVNNIAEKSYAAGGGYYTH